jgi:hypothetical protein
MRSNDSFETRMKSREKQTASHSQIFISRSLEFQEEKKKILRHFVNYVMRALGTEEDYKIYLVDDRHKFGIFTTADYLRGSQQMFVYAKGRALIDILRSIAHEFVHVKQYEAGDLSKHYLHFDNESEDEANELAGELVNAYSEVMGHDRVYESD